MKKLFQILLTVLGILIVLGLILFFNRQHTRYISQTTSSIVEKLQAENRLTSASMTVTKIIESQKDLSDNFFGVELLAQMNKLLFDDRLIMTVEGVVNAGIDLSNINHDNILITAGSPDKILIQLPDAEIFDVYLTEKTKPFERSLGILSKGDINLETQMRNQAIQAIKTEALDGSLLEQASKNAQDSITKLLHTIDSSYVVEYQ